MRINKFVAHATGMSRRSADTAIIEGRVLVNTEIAKPGREVAGSDRITLDGHIITLPDSSMTIMLNKPVGYVCSRKGQGSKTIYDFLPKTLHQLKPVGRLDKDSSGLLLLTNDGDLANRLTHPKFQKEKSYEVELDKPLAQVDQQQIESGIRLEDGKSALQLSGQGTRWNITIHEGRNRQIRRTFDARGYKVIKLHRTTFSTFKLGSLDKGEFLFV